MSGAPLRTKLNRHLEELTGTPRTPKSSGHLHARQYIRTCLENAGFSVEERRFDGGGIDGINVLTQPVPARDDLPLFIVGAHYDSVTGSPGADDNASGVAALLALADEIGSSRDAANRWTSRLQLAAYDLEEYGILGSWVQARELRQSAVLVRGMIALEMLGYTDHRPGSQRLPPHLTGVYPDVGDFIGLCGNESSRAFVQLVEAGMRTVEGLKVESLVVPGKGEMLGEVRLSDHSSFWDVGYPALMITDTSFFRNPHYHTATDTIETLDLGFLENVTRGVYATVPRVLKSA